jgi:transposase-like protein
MVSHPVLAAIAAHTEAVERGKVSCTAEHCPICGQRPAVFKYHASRPRCFRVIVDQMVQAVASALTRWKCPACEKTFTLYPDFALPHKRYVCQVVCGLSERYVADDELSYRAGVQIHGRAVYYDADAGAPQVLDDRVLWPSTLHRWIGWLGRLRETLRTALQLIRAQSATCDVFRHLVALPARKYRSERRKGTLQACGRLLRADGAYRQLFQTSIFPYLATACGWR